MKSLRAIDIIYTNAPDSQKVWIETTNRYWLDGGLRSLKKSLENHVWLSKSLADSILNPLPKKPKVAVDIGAGYGGVAINFALMGIKTIAVEPSLTERSVMKYLISRYPKAGKNITVITGFAESLPIESNSIDLCILSQVLEHVSDLKVTIREIARVLKKVGYCHLSSPNYLFPVEQHYRLPYFPLMPKKLFASWAIFLLKKLNVRQIENVKSRDFSEVFHFIGSIQYTTDQLIKHLCSQNKLRIVWSSRDEARDFYRQIVTHWRQNQTLAGFLLILASLPKKMARTTLATMGILPMKLEYLIKKS